MTASLIRVRVGAAAGAALIVAFAACTQANPAFQPRPSPDDAGPIVDAASEGAPSVDGRAGNACAESGGENLALCVRCEGNVQDESIRRLAITHSAVAYAEGGDGRACSLGPASRLTVVESSALDLAAFTLQAWINPRVLPGPEGRAGLVDRDVAYGLFLLPGGSIVCRIPGGTAVTVAAAAKAGVWTSIACTLGEGFLTLWVEGKRVGDTAAADLPSRTGSGVALASNHPSGDHFDGLMDNIVIWRGVRTAEQICKAARSCR